MAPVLWRIKSLRDTVTMLRFMSLLPRFVPTAYRQFASMAANRLQQCQQASEFIQTANILPTRRCAIQDPILRAMLLRRPYQQITNEEVTPNIIQAMNRNNRKPKRANKGSRPCSRVSRRAKRRAAGNWRR